MKKDSCRSNRLSRVKGHGTEHTTKEYEEISEGKVVGRNILPKNYEEISEGNVMGRNILPKNMKRSQKERSWDGTYYRRIMKISQMERSWDGTYYQRIWRDLRRKGGWTEHTIKEYEEISDEKVIGRNILPKIMKRSQKERWLDGTYHQRIWRYLRLKGRGTEHTTKEYEEISEGKVVERNILPKNMKRS